MIEVIRNLHDLNSLLIREIRPTDYHAIDSIALALTPTWFTEAALPEIAQAVRNEHGRVAFKDGVQVGFATYNVSSNNQTAQLTWISVHPDLHRQGVGRKLIESIERELSSEGVLKLEVCTVAATVQYEPYARTRSFYHAIGFNDVSVEPKGFPSGDDKLLLRKHML